MWFNNLYIINSQVESFELSEIKETLKSPFVLKVNTKQGHAYSLRFPTPEARQKEVDKLIEVLEDNKRRDQLDSLIINSQTLLLTQLQNVNHMLNSSAALLYGMQQETSHLSRMAQLNNITSVKQLFSMPLEYLKLPNATIKPLNRQNIYYIRDLLNLTSGELFGIKGIGEGRCKDILNAVHRVGLLFKDERTTTLPGEVPIVPLDDVYMDDDWDDMDDEGDV